MNQEEILAPAIRRASPHMITPRDNAAAMRSIVDLPDGERAQLDALCRQKGVSRAEALRQLLRADAGQAG